ncbi:hypothetical protein [Actinomycetospora flava]|uniref:PE family protein n=1 Tax=Actinomycetospora flava TaxID=3129232 RepID=A0ABU8LZI5_9PSEU
MARDQQTDDDTTAADAPVDDVETLAGSPFASAEDAAAALQDDPAEFYETLAMHASNRALALQPTDPRAASFDMGHARAMAELSTRRELQQVTLVLADVARSLKDIHDTLRRQP